MAYTQVKAEQVTFAGGATSLTGSGTSKVYNPWGTQVSVQANVAGTGAVTADVAVQVSNDNVNWITASTISLTATTSDTDGVAVNAAWAYYRLDVTNVTGTGATVTAFIAGVGA